MLFSKIPEASPMPIPLELVFLSTSIVLVLVGSFHSGRARRQFEKNAPQSGKKGAKMRFNLLLVRSLYILAWTICWAVGSQSWQMRASFGALSIFVVLALLHRLDSLFSAAPPYDTESTLELESRKV
jgi:hypothetical protein